MKNREESGMGQSTCFLLEAETGEFRIQCQPDLHREFQASLDFIEKPLKNETEKKYTKLVSEICLLAFIFFVFHNF